MLSRNASRNSRQLWGILGAIVAAMAVSALVADVEPQQTSPEFALLPVSDKDEAKKLRRRTEHLERQLDEANRKLEAERKKTSDREKSLRRVQVDLKERTSSLKSLKNGSRKKTDRIAELESRIVGLNGEHKEVLRELQSQLSAAKQKGKSLQSDVVARKDHRIGELELKLGEQIGVAAAYRSENSKFRNTLRDIEKTLIESQVEKAKIEQRLQIAVARAAELKSMAEANDDRAAAEDHNELAALKSELESRDKKLSSLATQLQSKSNLASGLSLNLDQLREQLRKSEMVRQEVDRTNATVSELERKLAEQIGVAAAFKSDLNSAKIRYDARGGDLNAVEKQLLEARKKLSKREATLNKLTDELAVARVSLGDRTDEVKANNDKVAALELYLSQLRTAVAESDSRSGEAQAKTAAIQDARDAATIQLRDAKQKVNSLEKDLGAARVSLQATESALGKSNKELRRLETARAEADKRIASLQSDVEARDKTVDKLKDELAVTQVALNDRTGELTSSATQLSSFTSDLSRLRGVVTDNESAFTRMRSDQKSLEAERNAALAALKAERVSAESLKAELNAEKSQLEKDNEAAMKLISNLGDDLEVRNAVIDKLETKLMDTEGVLQKTTGQLKAKTELVKGLKADIARLGREVGSKDAMVATMRANLLDAANSRDEAVSSLIKRSKSADSLASSLEATRKKLRGSQDELDVLRAQQETLAKEKQDATAQAKLLRKEVADGKVLTSQLEHKLSETEKNLEAKSNELSEKTSRLSAFTSDLKQLQSRLTENETALSLVMSEQKQHLKHEEQMAARSKESDARISNLEKELTQTRTSLNESQASLDTLKAERQTLANERDTANQKVTDLQQQLAARNKTAKEFETLLATKKNEFTSQANILGIKSNELTSALADLSRFRDTVRQNETTSAKLRLEQKQLEAEHDKARKRVAELKEALASSETEAKELAGKLTEATNSLSEIAKQLKAKSELATKRSTELAVIRGQLDERKTAFAALNSEQASLSTAHADAKGRLKLLGEKLAARSAAALELESQIEAANREIEDRTNKLKAKTYEATVLGTKVNNLQDSLRESQKSLSGLRTEKSQLQKARDVAIEDSKRLQNELASSNKKADEANRKLRDFTRRPASLLIRQENGAWRLTGEVNDQATRGKIEKAVASAFAGSVINELGISEEVKPARWQNAIGPLLLRLRDVRIRGLEVGINNDAVSIDGEVVNQFQRDAISRSLEGLDWGRAK